VPERGVAADNAAADQTKDTAAEKIHRAMSLDQTPAVISRMTSWKEASKDYSAMQVYPSSDAWMSSTSIEACRISTNNVVCEHSWQTTGQTSDLLPEELKW
jgi:hypothetical protein